jgi:hypothetical protein
LRLLAAKKWEELEAASFAHLRKRNTSNYRAFYYKGVANYKQQNYDDAKDDFLSALGIMTEDA